MVKKAILFMMSIFLMGTMRIDAQENGVKVVEILNPNSGFLYASIDSSEVVIRILNEGPNDLIAGDQFKVKYTLSDGSGNGQEFDTLIAVGSPTLVSGRARIYTINSNLKFNGDNLYSVCAGLTEGTVLFPTNSNKFSTECETFTVSIEEVILKVKKLYVSDNQLNFNLSSVNNIAEIYDITGKLILSKTLRNNTKHQIQLNHPAKGFYFLKIIHQSGKSTTAKFVVH